MADTSPDVKDSKMTSEENPSVVTELKELVSLLEKGHITPDEFKGFKKALLARADAKETTEQDPHGEALLERIVQLEKDANTIKEMNKALMTRIRELEEFQENAEKHFKNIGFSKEQTCLLVEENMEFYYPLKDNVEFFFCIKNQCLGYYYKQKNGKTPVLDKNGDYSMIVYWDRKLVTKDPDEDEEYDRSSCC
jgi:hypothetical protein